MNKIDLNGRCAVVTGGAQGFGRAITERFVASGAKVAIWDHDQPLAEKTAKEIGSRRSRAFKVDVSDLAAVEKTRRRDADKRSARSTSSSTMPASPASTKTVWETDLEEWRKVLAHQSRRAVHLLQGDRAGDGQAELRPHRQHRLDRRQGRQSQRRALFGFEGRPDRADEVARQGTRAATTSLVNAVTPAAAKTAIFDQMTQQHIDFMLSKIPKGRFVLVEELAAMVAWLASEDCAFSTGAVFDISGGRARRRIDSR